MRKGTFRREQSGLFVQDGSQELVRRAQPLHKKVSLTVLDHLHCLCNSLELYRIVDNRKYRLINTLLFADIHDHVSVSDKSDIDKSELHGLGCRRYGMVIHTPGRNHPFSGVAALQEGEYFIEILQHGFRFFDSFHSLRMTVYHFSFRMAVYYSSF